MSDNIIETLRIEVTGDSSSAVGGLEKLIDTLDRIKKITSGSNKGLNSIEKHLEKISNATNKINSGGVSKLSEIANGLKELGAFGYMKNLSKIADRILDLGTAIDCLKDVDMSKLNEMTNGLAAIRDVEKVSTLGTVGDASPVSSSTSTPDGKVQIDPSTVADTTVEVEGLGNALSETGMKFEHLNAIATKAFSGIRSAAIKMGGVIKSVFGGISTKLRNLVKMFTSRVAYRAMNAVISAITTSMRDGVNAIYQYSKSMNGFLAKSLDTLATSFKYLKASLGAMVAPLIVTLTPAIEWVIDKFVDFLNIINQVFARLSGASTWTKATKVATEYAAAADDATAANKKLKKSLLGMDEINTLTDNSSNGSASSSASDNSGYVFTEVPLDNAYVDGIIDKLKDILWYVGAIKLGMMGWDLGKALSKIGVGSSAIALATGLMLTVTGLVIEVKGLVSIISDGIDWQNLLETLGGGGAVVAGGALIGKTFGSSVLGAAIGAIVAGIPMYITGIWDAIKEGLNWLSAALIGAGATLTGAGIGAIIGMCGGPIGAGIGALIGLAVGALTDLTILIIQSWDSIVAWCSQALSDIGQFFVNLWDGICEVWSVAAEWFDIYVIQPVTNFFSSLWEGVTNWAVEAWNSIKSVFSTIGSWINTNIIQPVSIFFSNLWSGFLDKAKAAWEGVKSVFSTVASFFKDTFEKAWQGIVKVFSVAGQIFVDIKNGIVSAFKAVVNGLITGLNKVIAVPFNGINSALNWIKNIEILGLKPFSSLKTISVPEIPLLADGGIVPAGQLFIANEVAPELVGNVGRQTAVMNNDQIVESVSQGVADANAEQNALLREEINILRKILDKDVPYSSYGGARSIISDIERKNRRDGKTVIPTGV